MSFIFGYIDPGTGSLLLSAVVGLGVAALYSIRGLFYRVIGIFTGKKIGIEPIFLGRLVFYSEGAKYWKVFKPVLDALLEQKKDFVFLSSESDDPGLKYLESQDSEQIEAHYIGNIGQATPFLNRLQANVVVMTTPQLGVIQLMRSQGVRHYCHIVHAPIDAHTYKFYAFDEFDSVLCPSKFHLTNLQFLEDLRQRKKKLLLETGCTYYDEMNTVRSSGEANLVLYAPTWGDKSSLCVAQEVMGNLLAGGYSVLFRPHPQSWISDKERIEGLCEAFSGYEHWALDENQAFTDAFSRCSLLLCDLSGMVYDFAFLYQKPIFAFNTSSSLQVGFEAYYLKQELSAISLLKSTGGQMLEFQDVQNTQDAKGLATIIAEAARPRAMQAELDSSSFSYEDFIYNFQNAGGVAAKQITTIQEQL